MYICITLLTEFWLLEYINFKKKRIHKFQKTTMATEYKVNVINMDNIESYIDERDVK